MPDGAFSREPIKLDGHAAGRAIGMLLARKKIDAAEVARGLDRRAVILRRMVPAVKESRLYAMDSPEARAKNVEWAAGELEAAGEIIRRLGSLVPRTAQDAMNEALVDILDDAILDMLELTASWQRTSLTDAEKLEAIRKIGEEAVKRGGL